MMNLDELYLKYREKVMGYVYGKVKNPTVAEDLCSEVFLKLTAGFSSFDPQKASLSTWIYTITRNTLYDYLRTNHQHCELDESASGPEDLAETVCREEMLSTLADALQTLPKRERELIIRRYYYDQTLKEIGVRLGVSYAYVKVLHRSSLKKLNQYFEKH